MEAIVFSVPRAAVCMVYWGMEGFLNLANWQVEKRSREPFLYHLVYGQINKRLCDGTKANGIPGSLEKAQCLEASDV